MIRPIPEKQGVGFCSTEPVRLSKDKLEGYRYEQVGRYHNYFFTAENYNWPEPWALPRTKMRFDAFSPNLNKDLHVGHLRNLAVAAAFSRLYWNTADFVAMLGLSLGEKEVARERLIEWLDFVGYKPEFYFDKVMACIEDCEQLLETKPGEDKYEGCRVWEGPRGPVVVYRSDGTPTYALHDLVFARKVAPHYYVTGEEQKEHFLNLGLHSDKHDVSNIFDTPKHLPLGLVLDPVTGKKMKSRDGNALSADDALDMVIEKLDVTPEPEKLAWNVLAWNFLHVSRSQSIKFDVEEWTKPESPGMYISYIYARTKAALPDFTPLKSRDELTDDDVDLLGFASYFTYWHKLAFDRRDLSTIAHFAHELARKIGNRYHKERIVDGRPVFAYTLHQATFTLRQAMEFLSMFPLEKV